MAHGGINVCSKCMIVGVNKCIALCFPLTHRAWSNFHSCCLGPPATPRPGGDLIICNHTMASGVKCQTTICRFNVSIMHFGALRCQSEQQLSTLQQLLCILSTFHHLAIILATTHLCWFGQVEQQQDKAGQCYKGVELGGRCEHNMHIGEWLTSAIVSPPIADVKADFSFRISDASFQLSIGKGSILS